MPEGLLATMRKWYVVDGVRPVRSASPHDLRRVAALRSRGVCDPYAVVFPYSNRTVVVSLLGNTVPFSVTVVAVTALAVPVVAVGAPASAVAGAAKHPIAMQIAIAVRLTARLPSSPFALMNAPPARRLAQNAPRATARPGSS